LKVEPVAYREECAIATVSGTKTVHSADGTRIAYELIGSGPPVILVDGALCYREMGGSRELAKLLSPRFTVLTYDRRGRGESADTPPYAVAREVEDLEALLTQVGAANVWGMSSGAALALQLAAKTKRVKKVAVYEAPFIVDDSRQTTEASWSEIGRAVDAGDRPKAVGLFLKSVGVPAFFRMLLRLSRNWPTLKAIAHTLPYDGELVCKHQCGKPLRPEQWKDVTPPTLVTCGEKSATWMSRANRSLAQVLPNGTYRVLERQTHMLKPAAHAPLLGEFFSD
jgi:pimeloyl-ACP methyl ester carboxylesterase